MRDIILLLCVGTGDNSDPVSSKLSIFPGPPIQMLEPIILATVGNEIR